MVTELAEQKYIFVQPYRFTVEYEIVTDYAVIKGQWKGMSETWEQALSDVSRQVNAMSDAVGGISTRLKCMTEL